MRIPWPTVRLGDVLRRTNRGEVPLPGTTYRQIGVKLWGEGAYERETMDGSQTKYEQLFRAEAGDIIVNKIWARNGSVAVVPESLAGCFGSGEFPMFAPQSDSWTLTRPLSTHWPRLGYDLNLLGLQVISTKIYVGYPKSSLGCWPISNRGSWLGFATSGGGNQIARRRQNSPWSVSQRGV
jgi:type I restriction enzyme S subunit